MRLIIGGLAEGTTPPPAPPQGRLRGAVDLFMLDRKGLDVSPWTERFYNAHLGAFLRWLEAERPRVRGIEDITVDDVRAYRAHMASRRPLNNPHKPSLERETLHGSQRALRALFRWARADGYLIDDRILGLRLTTVPQKEMTVFTADQLRRILAACTAPEEEVAVRLLVGSGVRRAEAVGLCTRAPDGLPDITLDSLDRGHADLRVRWNAGAKGQKTRRVPITPALAARVRRYEARERPAVGYSELLISAAGRPFTMGGLDSMMDRLRRRVGFRVHCHAFRHTFATVMASEGANLERLRTMLGHEDYHTLLRYVRLATVRDLGARKEWEKLVALP